jgi:hypothetical protein
VTAYSCFSHRTEHQQSRLGTLISRLVVDLLSDIEDELKLRPIVFGMANDSRDSFEKSYVLSTTVCKILREMRARMDIGNNYGCAEMR